MIEVRAEIYSYESLKAELRHSNDADPWGVVMGAFFEVAGCLYEREECVPDGWGYKPGLSARGDPDDYWYSICDETDSEVLLRFGVFLNRYVDKLRVAGKDY